FAITYNNSVADTNVAKDRILKYRIEHTLKADLQLNWKGFSIGYTARYYSSMRQIDPLFTSKNTPFETLPQFLERQGSGAWVFDARISFEYKKYRLAFIVDNLFNAEYSVRPLGIAPPRLTTVQISMKF